MKKISNILWDLTFFSLKRGKPKRNTIIKIQIKIKKNLKK